jgi:hypothetical protein
MGRCSRVRQRCCCYLTEQGCSGHGEATADRAPRACRRTGLWPATLDAHAQGKASSEHEQQKLPKKKLRMTTSVQLAAGPPAPVNQDAKPDDGSTEAMAGFPAEMQRYMQAEGFAQPTPIQQQCAPGSCMQFQSCKSSRMPCCQPGAGAGQRYCAGATCARWRSRAAARRWRTCCPPCLGYCAGRQSSPAPACSSLFPPGGLRCCSCADQYLGLVLHRGLPCHCRELAQQVAAACGRARGLFQLRTACLYGGANRDAQVGCHINASACTPRPSLTINTAGGRAGEAAAHHRRHARPPAGLCARVQAVSRSACSPLLA